MVDLFVCIDEDMNLHQINIELRNNEISFSGHEYSECRDDTEGEKEARERLEDPDYWEEIGFITAEFKNCILYNHIDWEEVADTVIANDGWENTNGEFYPFGEYNGNDWSMNLMGCGQHDEWAKYDNNKWLIDKDDALRLHGMWQKYHCKKLDNKLFNKLKDEIEEIVKRNNNMCEKEYVIKVYKELEEDEGSTPLKIIWEHTDKDGNWSEDILDEEERDKELGDRVLIEVI